MATRHGSRRSKAEQWLFGMKWRGTAKETRNTVVPDAKPSNPNTIEKDEGIFLEKSRVHLHGLGQRETIDVVPGRRSDVIKTIEKDEGICLEKSRVHLNGPGHRATMDIVPERRSDVAPGRSMPEMEINITEVIAVLGVKVMAADMPPFMQLHAFQCAKRSFDSLDKFSSRQLAHDVKKVNCVQL
jgi:dynein light chain LC8-type